MSSTSDMGTLVELVDRSRNAPSQLNTNFTTIRTAFNDSMDVDTGHNHDGVTSRETSSGIGEFSIAQLMIAFITEAF